MLNTLATDIAGDAGIVTLTCNLIDLVNIDDALLRTLDVVIAFLQQLLDDVLDIFAHVTGFGQRGRIGHREGYIQRPRQSLC